MIAETWETRGHEALVFHYHQDSFAEQNLEAIVAAYDKALADVSGFLGLDAKALPRIDVYLAQFVPSANGSSDDGTGTDGRVAGAEEAAEGPAEIWTVVNSESPDVNPELELTRLLLAKVYGPPTPETRFWYDGLAGYLAGKEGGSNYHAEAPERVRKLFTAGQLPATADLLASYGIRQSATGVAAATSFVGLVVKRWGADRYKRFLAGLSAGTAEALRRAYGQPLQSLEQAWYLDMETAASADTADMRQAIRALVPYMKLYRLKLVGILICILITIAFTVFMPQAIRFLVNNILARAPLPFPVASIGPAGYRLQTPDEQRHALMLLLGAMVVFFVLSAIANARRSYLVTSMSEGVNYDLRMRLYDHLHEMATAVHRRTPNTELSTRFWTDVATVSQALSFGIIPMAQSLLAMLIFGVVLISLNWKLSLIALAGLPIFAWSFSRMRAKTRETARERTRRTADVSLALGEILNANEKVKLYGLREYMTHRFVGYMEVLRALVVRITLMASTSTSTSALITNGAQVAILVVGGLLVIQSTDPNNPTRELTAGDLMAFYVMLLQLYTPAGTFTSSMQFVNQATTSLDRLNTIFREPAEDDATGGVALGPLREALRLEGVNYGRTKGKDLVRDLSFEVKAGTKVAVVGPPGAGKASLMELLPRLFEVAGGTITWDRTDIRAATLASLRRQLAVVSQESYVFRATLYDNLRYGRVDATDEEVIAAARRAGLHEFITDLPGGYDTQVSDRDTTLGLVQRQRLAVARAILQDASVILMDDALSALDTPTQKALEDELRGPDGDKTMIRVAQRLGSILDADQILVMDGGKLVEQGTHDELLNNGQLYTQLLKDELGAGAVSGAFQAVRRLARQAPFSSLSPEVLEEVARLMLYAERNPGDIVCRQGTVGDELFVLGKGEVEVVLEEDEHGEREERILGFLNEGDYFGEISFLRRVPRTATIRARTNVELHILRRQDFDGLLDRLGQDVVEHFDRTAQARIEATHAKLVGQSS